MRVGTDPIPCNDPDSAFTHVFRTDARKREVDFVLNSDPDEEDARSQWQWFRLPNGDLILGVFPQGSTYLSVVDGGVDV